MTILVDRPRYRKLLWMNIEVADRTRGVLLRGTIEGRTVEAPKMVRRYARLKYKR